MGESAIEDYKLGQYDQVHHSRGKYLSAVFMINQPGKTDDKRDHKFRKQGSGADKTARGNAGEPISWEEAYSSQIKEHSVLATSLNYK